jgi:hypothetical protein
MASQVAPGYNPEVSLLQGGNAPIVPVQGGGGMEAGAGLPPDYNPSNSLLNVGVSVPIVPIRGGSQEGGDGKTAYEEYVIERYEPTLTSVSVPTMAPEVRKGTLIPLVQLYKKAVEPKLLDLKSFLRDPMPFVPEDEDSPLYKICPTPGGVRSIKPKFFQRVRRRIVTITYENPKIFLFPNINGEVSKFVQYMKLVTDDAGMMKPGYFVLLTGSFFSENRDENAMLYIEFLKAKQKNPETLYHLIELTPEFVMASCELYKVIYSESYLEGAEGKNRPLVPFFEPNIVIFRTQHLVFKTSELPIQRDDPTVKVSEMLTKTPPEKYASIVITPRLGTVDELPGNTGDAPEEKKYFRFDLSPTLYKFFKFPPESAIQCPKGKSCQNFKAGYTLNERLADDLKLPETGIYVIYKNTDKMPLLKEEGATLSAEELAALSAAPKPPAKIEATKEEKPVPTEAVKEEEGAKLEERAFEELAEPEVPLSLKEQYKASPLITKALEERTVEVNSFKFFIRYPLEEGISDDWKEGKFTQSEVDFLNMLELTPSLVKKAFGTKFANQKLAEFLQSIVLSNCFEDVSLLSKNECSNTHAFVKQIYFTKLRFLLESMYNELGVLKPLSFLDLIALLKKLLKDKPLEPIRISKANFRGDLLDPLKKIYFDTSTGLFSIDFSTIPEDIKKEIKFYRFTDMDYNTVVGLLFGMMESLEEEEERGPIEPEEEEEEEKKPSMVNRLKTRLTGSKSKFRNTMSSLKRSLSSSPSLSSRAKTFFSRPGKPSLFTSLKSPFTGSRSTFGNTISTLKRSTTPSTKRPSFFTRPGSPKTPFTKPPPTPERPYVLEDIRSYNPPTDYFDVIQTAGDGLCFYRAILKGLQKSPTSNKKSFPSRYNPNEKDSVTFIKQVKEELEKQRGTLEIGGVPVEEFFNEMYAPKAGEEKVIGPHADGTPFTIEEKRGRIQYKGSLHKMRFQEYLDLMDTEKPEDIPYADSDAGVGQIAALLKDILLVVYRKLPDGTYDYTTKVFYNTENFEENSFPLSKVVFLENVNGNHYNLLKAKSGKEWPHREENVVGGGEEHFDLGEPLKRRFTRRNKKRNQK